MLILNYESIYYLRITDSNFIFELIKRWYDKNNRIKNYI